MLEAEKCRVIARYPHDPGAFTQGLIWKDGWLYESSGLAGSSTIRKVRLRDGRVMRSAPLPDGLFGEGIAAWGDEIIGLTWRDRRGFRWDRIRLEQSGEFTCPEECWGLAEDGDSLIMSNGTPTLCFLDPVTIEVRRRLLVTAGGRPFGMLNALQYIDGQIYANVLTLPIIVRIDPWSGRVSGVIDLTGIVAEAGAGDPEKMANGIAWDAEKRRLFVTGKNWPTLYEIGVG